MYITQRSYPAVESKPSGVVLAPVRLIGDTTNHVHHAWSVSPLTSQLRGYFSGSGGERVEMSSKRLASRRRRSVAWVVHCFFFRVVCSIKRNV